MKMLLYFMIFTAPLNAYRIPVTSGVTLSFAKITLLVVLICLSVTLLQRRQNGLLKVKYLSVFNWPVFILTTYLILMTLYSLQPRYGLKIVFLIYVVYLMMFVVFAYRQSVNLDRLVKVVVISSILVSSFACLQLITFIMSGDIPAVPFIHLFPLPHEDSLLQRTFMWYLPGVIPRIYSFMTEPNSLGGFLSLSLFVSIVVYLDRKNEIFSKNTRRLASVNLIVSLLPLIGSFSRSGWLTLLLGVLFLAPIFRRQQLIRSSLVLLVILGGIGIYSGIVTAEFLSAIGQRIQVSEMGGHIGVRLKALELWYDKIWFGVGLGSYGILIGAPKGVSSTHSYYVTYLVEGGLIGFILYAWLVTSFIIKGLKVSKFKYNKNFLWVLPNGLFILIAFNNIFYHNYWMEFTWIFYSIGLISLEKFEEQRKSF